MILYNTFSEELFQPLLNCLGNPGAGEAIEETGEADKEATEEGDKRDYGEQA